MHHTDHETGAGRTGDGSVTRRAVLAAGGASATTVLAAACSVTYEPLPAAPPDGTAAPGADGGVPSTAPDAVPGMVLGAAAEVPVGGGTVYPKAEVVVTQPRAGDFKAFSAICTHMHCLVSGVSDGTIYCPCHGSRFSITDGSVVVGPATLPLPAKQVADDAGTLHLA